MKKFVSVCTFLLAGTLLFSQSRSKKAVFIIVDGIPADVIEKLDLPNLKAIAKEGGYAHAVVGGGRGAYNETPTISAVGYNSVLTGTWVNKHNVWDNDIKAPNYNYKNIFRLLKEYDPAKKIGIFSSWEDNRTKLAGEGLAAAGDIKFDYHFDGLELDTNNYPHDAERNFMKRIDEKVSDAASECIKNQAPDLSWVYLEYTDDMGHKYGDSPQYYDAIANADRLVGKVWQAVQYRQKEFNEDWLIIITTDHGRDPKTGRGHGGQSDRERAGWIFTNAKNLNGYFRNNHASIVDIMPTIARFMNIKISIESKKEIDGIPFIGKLSITDPVVILQNRITQITWTSIEAEGMVKIFVAPTNSFKSGVADKYQFIKSVPAKKGQTMINLEKLPSGFYKFYLEGKYNSVNRWASPKRK